jgi:hypothetical protein
MNRQTTSGILLWEQICISHQRDKYGVMAGKKERKKVRKRAVLGRPCGVF